MKHRWRVDLNWLSGATASSWLRLVAENRPSPVYAHRVALVTALSLYNSALARYDAVAAPPPGPLPRRPVFVVGHWRSGTTLLYHLLAADPRHRAPNAFEVVNPRTFPSTQAFSSRVFRSLIPKKRLQDDLPLGFDRPEEDEYALALLSGCSPYLGRSFPERLAHYERFLTFEHATDEERRAFLAALADFTRRLSDGRTLVLKSPPHTARIPLLLRLFPDARFVHVHRHPDGVFRSTRHLYDTVDWLWALQRRPADDDDTILRQYGALTGAWLRDRGAIPTGQLVEVAYDALAADPIATLSRVYDALDLGPFDAAGARSYLADLGDYRTNRFSPLSAEDTERLWSVAAPFAEAYGYRSGG